MTVTMKSGEQDLVCIWMLQQASEHSVGAVTSETPCLQASVRHWSDCQTSLGRYPPVTHRQSSMSCDHHVIQLNVGHSSTRDRVGPSSCSQHACDACPATCRQQRVPPTPARQHCITHTHIVTSSITSACIKQVSAVANWSTRQYHCAVDRACNKLQWSNIGARRYYQLSWPTTVQFIKLWASTFWSSDDSTFNNRYAVAKFSKTGV